MQNLPIAPGRSLPALVNAGDDDWRRLMSQLGAIERMFDGGALTDDILGLPFEDALDDARAQADAISAAETAAIEAALRRARLEWGEIIEIEASAGLGAEGPAWLAGPWADSGASRRDRAEASAEGLGEVRAALRSRLSVLAEKRRREVEVEGFRQELRRAAEAVYEADHALLFEQQPAGARHEVAVRLLCRQAFAGPLHSPLARCPRPPVAIAPGTRGLVGGASGPGRKAEVRRPGSTAACQNHRSHGGGSLPAAVFGRLGA
ncbi:MAG: hypothetical protein ACK4Y4_09200 [Brevundimonas sp.]